MKIFQWYWLLQTHLQSNVINGFPLASSQFGDHRNPSFWFDDFVPLTGPSLLTLLFTSPPQSEPGLEEGGGAVWPACRTGWTGWLGWRWRWRWWCVVWCWMLLIAVVARTYWSPLSGRTSCTVPACCTGNKVTTWQLGPILVTQRIFQYLDWQN